MTKEIILGVKQDLSNTCKCVKEDGKEEYARHKIFYVRFCFGNFITLFDDEYKVICSFCYDEETLFSSVCGCKVSIKAKEMKDFIDIHDGDIMSIDKVEAYICRNGVINED